MDSELIEIYDPLSDRENDLGKIIFQISLNIHKKLGPGLLESVYEKCFIYELSKRGIPFANQKLIPINYDELLIENALKVDILVDDLVIIELKAQENYHPVWDAQLLSYLKLTNKRLGFLINFHVPLIKQGLKRFVI
jgi:GxxExxY protein